MICCQCKEDRNENDFLLENKSCYKCVYKKKLGKIKITRKCRVCNELLAGNKWAYCSDECSSAGWAKQKKDYWVNHVKSS